MAKAKIQASSSSIKEFLDEMRAKVEGKILDPQLWAELINKSPLNKSKMSFQVALDCSSRVPHWKVSIAVESCGERVRESDSRDGTDPDQTLLNLEPKVHQPMDTGPDIVSGVAEAPGEAAAALEEPAAASEQEPTPTPRSTRGRKKGKS